LQSEVTYLEQSSVFPDRPPIDFYAGRATLQGYTNRGQVIGAAIGTGCGRRSGSRSTISIRIGERHVRRPASAGERRAVPGPAANFFRHDITALAGVRGGPATRHADFAMETTFGYRFKLPVSVGRKQSRRLFARWTSGTSRFPCSATPR